MSNEYNYHPINFIKGSDTSGEVNVGHNNIVGFDFPTGFDGTSVTFSAARTLNGEYKSAISPTSGAAITVAAGSNVFVPVLPADFTAFQQFKMVSNNPVTEDRTAYAITRKFK